MGTAMDRSINVLLESKDLAEAIKAFDKSFRYNFINNVGFSVPESLQVVYAKKDFDEELLLEEDRMKLGLLCPNIEPVTHYQALKEQGNLTSEQRRFFNLANWLSMRRKGHFMLQAYHEKILPKIKQVLAVQKSISIENEDGDKITGYIDLIVEWEDGKRYLLDNKTSAMEYDPDSASKSQQLILYYHACKEEYKLEGVGFVVMYKQLNKNRIKICSKCQNNGTGKRHKTCDAEMRPRDTITPDGVLIKNLSIRCNGDWIETISPECRIETILNQVTPEAENLVMETFDEANEGIKKEVFPPNLESCDKYGTPCQFARLCWENNSEDLDDMKKANDVKANS